jgi:hypothetical protein
VTRRRLQQIDPNPTVTSPIALPTDWSPTQAVAVFELLDELREHVWRRYGAQIQRALREQISVAHPSTSKSDIDEDDVPF